MLPPFAILSFMPCLLPPAICYAMPLMPAPPDAAPCQRLLSVCVDELFASALLLRQQAIARTLQRNMRHSRYYHAPRELSYAAITVTIVLLSFRRRHAAADAFRRQPFLLSLILRFSIFAFCHIFTFSLSSIAPYCYCHFRIQRFISSPSPLIDYLITRP